MKNQQKNNPKLVYSIVGPAYMKFQPYTNLANKQQPNTHNFVDRLKSFFKVSSWQTLPNADSECSKQQYKQKALQQSVPVGQSLKYVLRLTNEDVLVGNQKQLDAIFVGGVLSDYIDTAYLWSINVRTVIVDVAVDQKKNLILLLTKNKLIVYQFNAKAIWQKPLELSSASSEKQWRFVRIFKGSFLVCGEQGIAVYELLQQTYQLKQKVYKSYNFENKQLKIFQLPESLQTSLKLFLKEKQPKRDFVSLWFLTVEVSQKQIRMGKTIKIRDVPTNLEHTLNFTNYSSSIYFMQIEQGLMVMRGAYVLDTLKTTKNVQNSHFKLVDQNKLIHISCFKMQTYSLDLDETKNPPKIQIKSLDSLLLPPFKFRTKFINIVNILGSNFLIVFQNDLQKGKYRKGEIRYALTLTTQLKVEQKLIEVFPSHINNVNFSKIQEKADIAQKMGLPQKDVYLNIWNKSEKSSVEDFKLLLDTMSYPTIREEIEKKLKKSSMSFRQVLLIEQGCMVMLHQQVFGNNCTSQIIKNYLISHLLTRKLQLYRRFSQVQKQQKKAISQDDSGKLLITIQSYNFLKNAHIGTLLLQLIQRYCNEDKDQIMKIRWLIRIFRFQLRTVYQNLLTEIIVSTKKKFIKLLQTIPELLPYQPQLDSQLKQDPALFQGIWNNFIDVEWQKSFYLDSVETIENKQFLRQVCQSVWFKRHWLSQHDFINLKRTQIQQIQNSNKSSYTFLYVIQALFDNITQPDILRQTIDYIQDQYSNLPQHVYGKLFLYRNLFQMFRVNNRVHKIQEKKLQKFSQFLNLKDCEIFKAMFNYQKIKKGFIMKQMKPLYYSLSGPEVFHQGLLNYFASDLSEVSDIKHLLNRMNNEKKQFHMQNQSIYEVIVRAMQLKLKIGSDKDIPIQEVIIYIQSIPLSENNPVQKDLQIMRIINEQAARFRNSHLNMSIFEITKNSNKVFMSLIYYEFESRKIDKKNNIEQLKQMSYQIFADLLILHAKIYSETDIISILFIYLARLMQQVQNFEIVKQLLNDTWVNNHFNCDPIIAENLVLYMRKWILHKFKTYIKAQNYLRKLLNFLPQKAPSRLYIQAELQLALLLSTEAKPVTYPLCRFNTYITLIEVQALIQNIPVDQLLKLEPEKLSVNMEAMQYWGSDCNLKEQKLENVYQIIILRLIVCRKIKEAVQKLKDLLNLKANNPYNFVYTAIIVSKISGDFIQENRKMLLLCCNYLFSKPEQLLLFIDQLIRKVQTNQQQKTYLLNKLSTCKKGNITFVKQNELFQSRFISQLKNRELEVKFAGLLEDLFQHLKREKKQFMKAQFYLLFEMLCNKPEVLVKYIYIMRKQINLKTVRFMISYISQCPLFKKDLVLEFGLRLFASIMESIRSGLNIQLVISQIAQQKISQNYQVPLYVPQTAMDYKLLRSIQKMKEKKNHIIKQSKHKKAQKHKSTQYKNLQQYIKSNNQFVYEYPDSDDNDFATLRSTFTKNEPKINEHQFDEEFNLIFLSSRSTTNVMLYLSIQKQREHRKWYYQQKDEKQFIYNQLSLDRPKQKNVASSNTLTDPIRNSNRISRAHQSQINQKSGNRLTPPQQSNRLLSIHVLDSHVNEPFQNEQLGIYKSMRCSSINGEHLKSQQILIQEEVDRNVMLQTDSEIKQNKVNLMTDNYKIQVNFAKEENEQKIRETAFKKQKSALLSQQRIAQITQNFEEKILREENIDFTTLQQQCEDIRIASLFQSIIKQSFLSQYGFSTTLKLIQAIQSQYPSLLAINHKSLQIYKKSEELQQKFSLDLPLKQIFVSEGMFLKDKKLEPLFEILVNNMYNYLSEDQLMKMCKVITIAFKKPDLQHQIIFGYLLQLIKFTETKNRSSGKQLSQSQKIFEKLIGYIRKLPPKYLKKRDVPLLKSIHDEKIRQRIMLQIVEWCMQRNDELAAQYFQQKYLSISAGMI